MRYSSGLLVLFLSLLVTSAGAGVALSDEELDQASARGLDGFALNVSPVVVEVPIIVINQPINITTVIDMPVNVNTMLAICSFCPGGKAPTIIANNPIVKDLSVSSPQITPLLTNVSVPTVVSPSVGNPSFRFP